MNMDDVADMLGRWNREKKEPEHIYWKGHKLNPLVPIGLSAEDQREYLIALGKERDRYEKWEAWAKFALDTLPPTQQNRTVRRKLEEITNNSMTIVFLLNLSLKHYNAGYI